MMNSISRQSQDQAEGAENKGSEMESLEEVRDRYRLVRNEILNFKSTFRTHHMKWLLLVVDFFATSVVRPGKTRRPCLTT